MGDLGGRKEVPSYTTNSTKDELLHRAVHIALERASILSPLGDRFCPVCKDRPTKRQPCSKREGCIRQPSIDPADIIREAMD